MLHKLPIDVLMLIIRHLDLHSTMQLTCACNFFHNLQTNFNFLQHLKSLFWNKLNNDININDIRNAYAKYLSGTHISLCNELPYDLDKIVNFYNNGPILTFISQGPLVDIEYVPIEYDVLTKYSYAYNSTQKYNKYTLVKGANNLYCVFDDYFPRLKKFMPIFINFMRTYFTVNHWYLKKFNTNQHYVIIEAAANILMYYTGTQGLKRRSNPVNIINPETKFKACINFKEPFIQISYYKESFTNINQMKLYTIKFTEKSKQLIRYSLNPPHMELVDNKPLY